MKSIGIIRRIDKLGRLTLPAELRKKLDLDINDPMEFYMDGESIVIRKYSLACVFCGEVDNTVKFGDKLICPKCLETIIGIYK